MTTTKTQTKPFGWIVAAAAAAAIFFLDFVTPLGVAVPMLYGIPLLMTWFVPGLWSTFLMIGIAMPLTWGGTALSTGELTADVVANRSMASALLLVIGWLVIKRKRLAKQRDSDQASLRESEERYALVMMGAEAAIWDWNVPEKRVFFSPRWKALRGLAEDEVSDHETEWSSRIHPDDRERVIAAVSAHFEGRTAVFSEEYRVCHKDGRWIWILDHGMAKRDSAGKVVRMAGSETDITARKRAEEALRESEGRFRTMAEAVPSFLFETDAAGWNIWTSEGWCRFTGQTPEQVAGHGWAEALHPDDRAANIDRWMQCMKDSVPFESKQRLRRRDGVYVWVIARALPVRDSQGKVTRWVGSVTNVDDIVRVQEALRDSEKRFAKAFQASPHPIGITEMATGRCIEVNEACLQLFGFCREEVIGNTTLMLGIWPSQEDRAQLVERLKAGEPVHNLELSFRTKSGELRHILVSSDLAELSGTLCLITVGNDITDRKRAEEALLKEESHYRTIFHEAGVGVAQIDSRTGQFLKVNQKYCEIVGLTQDEMLATTFMHITHPDDLAEDLGLMDRLRRGDLSAFTMEKRYVKKDGAIVWVSLNVAALWQAGEMPSQHIAVVQDISQRKQMESALRESEERLQLFIEYAPSALAMFDRNMRYLAVSRRWMDDYGLGDRSLIGRSHYDVFPEIKDGWKEAHQRGLAGEVVREEEDCFERADGSVQWLRWEVRPWRGSGGQVGGIVIFTEDITERKAVSQALRDINATLEQRVKERTVALVQANERWDWVVRATNDGVWDWDLVHDTDYFSPRWKEMHGFQERDQSESSEEWRARIHPEDRQSVLDRLEAYLRGEWGEYWEEYRVQRKDGAYIWVLDRGVAIRDEQGRAVRMVGAETDITWRKGVEQALRFREEQFHTLADNVPAHFAYIDGSRCYQFLNKHCEALFQRPAEALQGMSVQDLLGPEDYAQLKPFLDQALAGKPVSFEYRRQLPGDGTCYLSGQYVPDRDDQGNVRGVLSLMTDITTLKSSEALLRAREAQLRELGVKLLRAQEEERRRISRDLHDDVMQRMGALALELYGLASTMSSQDEGLQSQLKAFGASAEQLTTDLQRMAHQLHPSVLEFGGLEMALREQVNEFGSRTGIAAEFITKDVPKDIPLDHATCLYRIVQEGLQNVQKHAEATTVLVRLMKTGRGLGLCIHDDGRGIEKNDEASGRKGLGLTSMAERVGMLNGVFRIRAKPGDGTELHAWVPLECET